MSELRIVIDDLSDGKLISLLQDHRREMLKHSPVESVHALDIESIHSPKLRFWSARLGHELVACAALKRLDSQHAELKSMKVSDAYLGKGIGRALLDHLLEVASSAGYQRLSLETGTMDVFIPARTLYESVGFRECKPFDEYVYDPHSVCMTLVI